MGTLRRRGPSVQAFMHVLTNPSFVSYEDLEGLVTTVGVLAALCAGFALTSQYMSTSRSMEHADFRYAVCGSNAFRTFVIRTMETYDIGKYEREAFNFTVTLDDDYVFDVKKTLSIDIGERWGNPGFSLKLDRCAADALTQMATELVLAEFPMHRMVAWLTRHPEVGRYSYHTERIATFSSVCVFVSLIWSILLYTSLTASPVRESSVALVVWSRLGWFMIFAAYLLLALGIILFFWCHGRVLMAGTAFTGSAYETILIVGFFGMMVPFIVVGLVVSVCLWAWSIRAVEKGESHASGRLDDVESGQSLPNILTQSPTTSGKVCGVQGIALAGSCNDMTASATE